MSIFSIIPDPETLLALQPEELAGILLQYLNSLPDRAQQLNRYNFSLPDTVREYPQAYWDQLSRALMEAWIWLEREGLLAPQPGNQGEWRYITRRGREMKTTDDLKAFRHATQLPKALLHPAISTKVYAAFLRGEYDTAAFQAFREVEVTVRRVGGFGANDLGTDLIDKAFHKSTGPLTDMSLPEAEREAMRFLFRGAIGVYKNPHSHRHVAITDPAEAIEMIMLANHLMRIAESRMAVP